LRTATGTSWTGKRTRTSRKWGTCRRGARADKHEFVTMSRIRGRFAGG
jgi:hypothetical protein